MITVLGKLRDTAAYIGRDGYNVMRCDDWSPERGRAWLDMAIQRGDEFILVSDDLTGEYRREVEYLITAKSSTLTA